MHHDFQRSADVQPGVSPTHVQKQPAPTSTGEQALQLQPAAVQAIERRPPLPALTGLRTMLALTILMFHFTPAGLASTKFPWFTLYPIVDIGYVFVSFFFLISGFILSYNYAHRPGGVRMADFWMARFSRLYPVYLLTMLISLPMLMLEWRSRSHGEFWTGAIATPLLVQGFFPKLATFWNTVSWTLSCEVVLYIAFPFLLRLRWPTSPRKLVLMVIGFWALGLLPHTLYWLTNPDHLQQPVTRYSGGTWLDTLKYTPAAYLCTFLAGLTLGRLHDAVKLNTRGRMVTGVAGFALAWLAVYHLAPQVPYILIHGGLLTPIWSLVILGLAGTSPLARIFSIRPLVAVGTSTYALYLLHFNVFQLLQWHHVAERLHVTSLDPWISYVFVVLLAMAVRRWVEHPCQKAIQGWWKRRHTTA
ncbi:MAG: acyltransferase family protein [Janthinobacterium lividum]